MNFFGWNKIGKKEYAVFGVYKRDHKTASVIGATVATYKTQRAAEADCLARNQEIAAKIAA